MTRILVVDDDPEVRRVLARQLAAQGFDVATVGNGDELRAQLRVAPPALVVLDLELGDEDGRELARELRTTNGIPILMLTGHGTAFDKVAGLEAGADDYLTKPYDLHELVARIRALLRRTAPAHAAAPPPSTWCFDGWTLREVERTLTAPDGTSVHLTARQFDLLAALVRATGLPVARDALGRALAGREPAPDDRRLDVLVTRLRRQLEPHGGAGLVKTLRGKGYLLAAQVERGAG